MIALALALLLCASPAGDDELPRIEMLELSHARVQAARTGRPIVVLFGAVWCSSCRRFQKEVLPALEIRALAPRFVWAYVEIDRAVRVASQFGVRGTPHLFVLGPDGRHLGQALGVFEPVLLGAFLERAAARAGGTQNGEERLADGDSSLVTLTPDGYRSGAICFSHVGYGPLGLPSQSPGQVLRPSFQPRTPSTLAQGQYEFFWSESVANIFAFREGDYRLDYLTVNSVLSLAYGVSDTALVEVKLSELGRYDSVLDPITDAFHDAFGLGDSGRDQFPSGDNVIDLEPRDGVAIEDRASGSESLNLTLALQHNITCGTERLPAVSWGVDATWHLGGNADLQGNSPLSLGLNTALARRLGESFYLYAGLGYAWFGLDEARGLPLEDEQWSTLGALEWRYSPRASWVLQYLVSEGVARDRDPFDDPSFELNLGWKKEVSAGLVLELGLIENIIEPDNSPDFGLHFALRRRY